MLASPSTATTTELDDMVVRTPDGKELCRFPAEVTTSLRRMLTSLMYQSTLPHSVACIAALSGEGVTYNTVAIAATLASDIDARVCVVELNWWSPGLQAMLSGQQPAPKGKGKGAKAPGAPEAPTAGPISPGAAAVIRGGATLEAALIKTSLPNLDLLPAGSLPAHERAGMARSDQLKRFLESLKEHYDYVFLDIPALSLSSDAIALTSCSEAALLIVLQGVTPANTIKSALDAVKHQPILGVVLNRVQLQTPRWLLRLLPEE